MAQTLVEAAKLSQNDLQRGVVESFIITSRVLDRLPLITINGNAYAYNSETTLPGVEFRAVNAAYTESTGTVTQSTETIVILGGDADVDTYIVQTRGNLNDQRAIQTNLKVKAINFKYQDSFFNGSVAGDANSFDGLKIRLTGNQVVAAATNGLGPVAGGHTFFDAIDDLLSRVVGGADVMYANSSIIAKMRSSARRLGGWTQTINDFGVPIDAYNNVPILDPGVTAAGVNILPQTETQGTAAGITSSIYAVKFSGNEAEAGVAGLTNGGIQVRDIGEIDAKPVFRTRVEFFCSMATFGKGAARLTGVLNA